jgi:hypothetical protein
LILAWHTIQNRHRALLFAFYLVVLPVFVGLFFGIVLENMIIKQHILANTLWGMPYLVLLVEGLAYLGYQMNRQHLGLPRSGLDPRPQQFLPDV